MIEEYVGPRGSYEIYGRTVLIPLRCAADRADAVLRKLLSDQPIPLEGVRRVAAAAGIEEKELYLALERAEAAVYSVRLFDQSHDMVSVAGLGAHARAR